MALALSFCILEAFFIAIRRLGDLSRHVPEAVILLLGAGAIYVFACYVAVNQPNSSKLHHFGAFVTAGAVVFRLTLWPLYPSLSDDPFRYRWEGKLQAAGGNPYQVRPADPAWIVLRDPTYPRVVGKDFKAVYGPLIEAVELWTYRFVSALGLPAESQVFWFKAPGALADLGLIAALYGWLRARGLPLVRLVVYAWSPVALIAFWATGHNDSLALFPLALAFWAAARNRWTAAFAGLAVATAAKLWPALLLPVFIGWTWRRPVHWYQWWVVLPILVLFAFPYWSDVTENSRFASGFVGGWRNNDSIYGLILLATVDVQVAKRIAFGIVFATVAAVTLFRVPLERASLAVITVLLAVSANCHPWYLTWILPLSCFLPVPALLLWSTLAPLAYVAVIDWTLLQQWNGVSPLAWYEYVPVYTLLAGGWLLQRFGKTQTPHFSL